MALLDREYAVKAELEDEEDEECDGPPLKEEDEIDEPLLKEETAYDGSLLKEEDVDGPPVKEDEFDGPLLKEEEFDGPLLREDVECDRLSVWRIPLELVSLSCSLFTKLLSSVCDEEWEERGLTPFDDDCERLESPLKECDVGDRFIEAQVTLDFESGPIALQLLTDVLMYEDAEHAFGRGIDTDEVLLNDRGGGVGGR